MASDQGWRVQPARSTGYLKAPEIRLPSILLLVPNSSAKSVNLEFDYLHILHLQDL